MHKKNPLRHSPQQNKKAMLTTAAYFKVSTPVTSCFSFTFVYQKTCFRSKTEKVNSTIEFCISESDKVPNFSLNWQFQFFRPNLPKKTPFWSEMEKVNITIEFCILKLTKVSNFSLQWQFWLFFWPNLPKNGISGRKRKNRTCAYAHGHYLLYQTFLHEGRQTQRYFNTSSPSSRRDNYMNINFYQ